MKNIKKFVIACICDMMIFGLLSIANAAAVTDAGFRGRIVLQADGHGELWYVNRAGDKRYPVKNLSVLVAIASTVNSHDLASSVFLKKNLGKVLVENGNRSRIWYVNPSDGQSYYYNGSTESLRFISKLAVGATSASLAKIPVDCGATGSFDLSCLVAAAQTCTPASNINTLTVDFFGTKPTTVTLYKIEGIKNGACVFYKKLISGSVVLPAGNPQSVIDKANQSYKLFVGKDGRCRFTTTELTDTLLRWSHGQFDSNDEPHTKCSGQFYNVSTVPSS